MFKPPKFQKLYCLGKREVKLAIHTESYSKQTIHHI